MNLNKIITVSIGMGLVFNKSTPLLLFANNNITNITSKSSYSNRYYFEPDIYPETIVLNINTCLNLLNKYEETFDKELLDNCISIFSSIPENLTEDYNFEFNDGDIFDYIFFTLRDHLYNNENMGNLQSDMIINFAENVFKGWRKNKSINVYKDKYLIMGLVNYNKGKIENIQDRLDYLKYLSENPDKDTFDDTIVYPEDSAPGFEEPIIPPPILEDENQNSNESGNNENNITHIQQLNGYFTEYIKKGNKCVKVKKLYKNNQIISSQEYTVKKQEYVKCGIYDYVHNTSSMNNSVIIDKNYIQSNQNLESEYSIHYTINKSSKRPYYFNSDIRTSPLDNSVTYNQLKDALYQLSIKSDGFSVVENDKFLAVVEGRPIVLKKSKTTYSKLEVERLLNSFVNIGFKILKPSESSSGSLRSYLINKKIDNFLFNGKTIKLSTPFILTENQLHGPIEEIATHLGAKTTSFKNKLSITKDSTNIKLNVSSKKYSVNNEIKYFISSPTIYNSSIYSEIDPIILALGYEIVWDKELGELSIYDKE